MIHVAQIRNGKAKKAVKLEMDMRNCIEIPCKLERKPKKMCGT